ncbi:uncharacterized protein A4U43_C04F16150 [Asparagus officinalis]|uniref:J domain-containing protein n=1 Tax=Asparagus officinalis TaxID=4686 RepID=A0A5P1F1A0_ASPOF|nr:uncharacterized protein LOC109837396 [Asparagus officinalis]XP_020261221.1 uncharacterized protein LOC109837396 [Asparagus officinalis]XP_020261222.1 uncharacterized protein LOC109837396 [Asparagus officinalis]XP_020261224.1 uncharacterized protein LOC109837396 [Asparagus officinalis]ONK72138.1 uncharacterized protein A4U43_C04F16150 [Asparagus officinalis]
MGEQTVEIRRAREAIKQKMRAGDYTAARTLILEALKVFPTLDRASEMLTVCEILCSAEMELPGSGIDWYWVLQLFASATPDAIKAQYQKIASQLNLIKNDFPGTEFALEFAADAFSVLSDPIKRAAFDSKRNAFQDLSQDHNTVNPSRLKRAASGVYSGNGDVGDKQKRKIYDLEASWVTHQVNSSDNDNPLKALGVLEGNLVSRKRPEKDFYDFENSKKAELFSVGQIWAAYDQEIMPRRYCKIDKVIAQKPQIYVTWYKACPCQSSEKKWQDAGFPFACGTFTLEPNKMTLTDASMLSYILSDGVTKETLEIYPKKGEVWAIYRDRNMDWCSNPGMRKNSTFDIVEILDDCLKDSAANVAYLVRVNGFKNVFQRYSRRGIELSFKIPADKLLMFSHRISAFRFIGGELSGISNGMLELDPLAIPDNLVQDFSCSAVGLVDLTSQSDEEKDCSDDASTTLLMNPSTSMVNIGGSKSWFWNRKVKLAQNDFAHDQVWAVYNCSDAMPRSYVKVNNVVSPTKVSVTILEPHPRFDKEIRWVEEELPFVCGIFRASKTILNLEMYKFSHLVNCDRSSKKTFYRIFPRKGEIWAMYRNWDIDWKTSSLDGYKCRMVEILSDFSEENGVGMICSLVQVPGCLTFFQRQMHDEFQLTKQISRLELLSLSHRVPAFTVIGIEHPDIPKGLLHLEPDALPPKLIS